MLRENAISRPGSRYCLASRPVIFLDIDGVLRRGRGGGQRRLDPDLLARFQQLVDATNARVVLASTWRHDPAGVADARRLQIPFDDVLPDLRPKSRAKEVEAWLAQHPETERYAVLDDEDDGCHDLPLFQPNPKDGLTSDLANRLEAYLKGERREDERRNVFIRMRQAIWFGLCGHKG